MKKHFFFLVFLSFGLFLNACRPAYVATVPTYREAPRPPRPSVNHVWVGENWVWQSQNRGYVQRNGYWQMPSRNRTYVPGYWQSNPRGHRWISGRWR